MSRCRDRVVVTPIMMGSVHCATSTSRTRWAQCRDVGLGMDRGRSVGPDGVYRERTRAGHGCVSGGRANRTPSSPPH